VADTHRITFDPVDIEMEVREDEHILDAAFRQGIHLMHGCREGRCSACKSFVLDGDIQMEGHSTFACNEAEQDEGFVLLCRTKAYSDCTIELLNFDEDELLGGIPIQNVTTRVVSAESVTADIVALRLEPIEPEVFEFKPGQYADLQIPGTDEFRSFSMASTPSTPNQVEFLIKKYPGGVFAALLDDGISVGDSISLTGPYGSSTLKDGHVLPVVCIGGGAGMAPVLSLVRHMSESGNTRPVQFYFDEIISLGAGLVDFTFVACVSDAAGVASSGSLSIEEGNVTDVVRRLEPDIAKAEVYLCGPPPMVDAALDLLDVCGTPTDQIFFDKFTSPAFD
jgi:propane monooxygenase reductase subunit